MSSGIYIATSGARAQQDSMDVTANNLANASTTGFKQAKVAFAQALTQAQGQSPDSRFVQTAEVGSDMSAGTLRETGNPLDLALVGDGFFAVDTPRGLRYTRAGDFRLDAGGQIVNVDGYPAAAQGGGAISIPEGTATVTVDSSGAVLADGAEVGRLELARFAPEALVREGSNLFVAQGAAAEGEAPEVVAGALEQSNVNAVRGMVDLVKVSRTHQALLRMIETYREVESRAARTLGSAK